MPYEEFRTFFIHSLIAAFVGLVLRKVIAITVKKLVDIIYEDDFEIKVMGNKLGNLVAKTMFFAYAFSQGLHMMVKDNILTDEYINNGLWVSSEISSEEYFYYLTYMTWYFQKLMTDPFEYDRSDFLPMMIHHWATCGVIFLSYWISCHRIGVLVMFLHDPSDLFLALAKVFRYIHKETASTLCFLVMIASWGYTRVWCFPRYPIYGSLWAWWARPGAPEDVTTLELTVQWTCRSLLMVLWVLNVWWFYLTLIVARDKIMTGKMNDVRSGSDKEKKQ